MVRLGGDEFVILLDQIDDPEMARIVARKILAGMREPMELDGLTLQITTSIGVAFAHEVKAQDDLLVAADDALYEAKESGRNQYRLGILGETTLRPR